MRADLAIPIGDIHDGDIVRISVSLEEPSSEEEVKLCTSFHSCVSTIVTQDPSRLVFTCGGVLSSIEGVPELECVEKGQTFVVYIRKLARLF